MQKVHRKCAVIDRQTKMSQSVIVVTDRLCWLLCVWTQSVGRLRNLQVQETWKCISMTATRVCIVIDWGACVHVCAQVCVCIGGQPIGFFFFLKSTWKQTGSMLCPVYNCYYCDLEKNDSHLTRASTWCRLRMTFGFSQRWFNSLMWTLNAFSFLWNGHVHISHFISHNSPKREIS